MAFKSEYLNGVYAKVCQRSKGEEEFLQAVKEVLESLEPVVEQRPDIVEAGIIERFVEPERFIQFRVSWVDDSGKVQLTEDSGTVQLSNRSIQRR
jgi:glutamate dehydrogenase (NADP+)